MADAADSKSAARECVRVRVPPPAPFLLMAPMSTALCNCSCALVEQRRSFLCRDCVRFYKML